MDALAHAHPCARAGARELDLVHEGDHDRNSAASVEVARPLGLDVALRQEDARTLYLDVDCLALAGDHHLNRGIARLKRVRDGLRRRDPKREAVFLPELTALGDTVDRCANLARRGGTILELQIDNRLLLRVARASLVPHRIPNRYNV